MKWEVVIPPPPAKRMAGSGKLFVQCSSGWKVYPKTEIELKDQNLIQFEIKDEFEHVHDATCLDGRVFQVWIEYSNASGSRTVKWELIPGKVQ